MPLQPIAETAKNMKIAPKIIICAILSISIGIAAAAPLLASELNITPFISHVKGPTADYNLDVVYANFTVQNPEAPITENSGPTLSYFAVVNVTNPSEYAAKLHGLSLVAAQKITNSTGQSPFGMTGNWSSGEGWEAKGAWVDGVWYNVTWVDGSYPHFDENGKLTQSPSPTSSNGHWMEGVHLYRRTFGSESGTTTGVYLNMNGTWVDVTGRITVDMPTGSSFSMAGTLVMQNIFFQDLLRGIGTSSDVNASGEFTDDSFGYSSTRNIITGDAYGFDILFEPNESRLIVVSGSWELRSPWADGKQLEALQSGNIDLKITFNNDLANQNHEIVDNTMIDTWAEATVLQQINVAHVGNSYIYNAALSDNQMFNIDQYGLEAFIVPRS
jgi:hypothetical protein